jgi:hypothetical protein
MKDIVIGTLCWFWDNDEEDKVIGIYGKAEFSDDSSWYWTDSDIPYSHCRPVKIEEIKLEALMLMKDNKLTDAIDAATSYLAKMNEAYNDVKLYAELAMEALHKV